MYVAVAREKQRIAGIHHLRIPHLLYVKLEKSFSDTLLQEFWSRFLIGVYCELTVLEKILDGLLI